MGGMGEWEGRGGGASRQPQGCRRGTRAEAGTLTSPFPALLHAVLVDVQREEHVRVAVVVLGAVLLVAPARGDGGVQEEGGLLGGGRPQLALVLQLEDTRAELRPQAPEGLPAPRAWPGPSGPLGGRKPFRN